MEARKESIKHTYADYLSWEEDECFELLDGIPYMQSAPTWQHQAIILALASQFYNYLSGKDCKVFTSPFDLRLPEGEKKDEDVTNVLLPDIVVVCDKNRLSKTGYLGVPELVIEVSSPSTSRSDRVVKFNKYEKSGVKEYWIVEPEGKYINVFALQQDNRYGRPESYTEDDKVKVTIFPDLLIDLAPVFETI